MSAEAASVVIAAGHGVVAQVVRRACEAQPGLQIVAEVHDGEALRRVCRDEHPDVIVLDELLDGVEPDLEALRALRQDGVSTAAVVLSDRSDGAAVLARMLVMRGVPLLTLQAHEDEHIPHGWVWKRGLRYQVKGEWDDRGIDQLYSERVLLKV